jgi:hypothetical protein
MDETTIRQRVREMLATGDLPCEDPAGMWAGRGEGKRCAACKESIRATEVEFEVLLKSGATILLHRACHLIWLQECEPDAATGAAPLPATS